MTSLSARAEIPDREWIDMTISCDEAGKIQTVNVFALGCHELTDVSEKVKKSLLGQLLSEVKWDGTGHADLLVSEVLLKIQKKFNLPIQEFELCHCRKIPTAVVDNAIVLGAHTPEKVTAWTSASSGCGTCRPDVQKMIQYRLKKMA